MSNTEEKFMKYAIEKAMQGIKEGQTPFGACLVKNDGIISCVHNMVWKTMDITAHAEVCAIREACNKLNTVELNDCILYSTCEPCPMCFSACHWAGISRIVYGAKIEDAKCMGFNELTISNETMKFFGNSRIEIVENVLRNESMELFKVWSLQEDRKVY